MKKRFLLLFSLLLCVGIVSANEDIKTESVNVGEVSEEDDDDDRFAQFRERRVDRGINKRMFIHKGEVMAGLSASYTGLDTENAEYFTLLTNLNVEGYVTSVKPYAAYFYRDNRAIGARFGYIGYSGLVESATLDLGETNDLSFDVPYLDMSSKGYSYAIFHRAYAPLDNRGNFGLFAEVELSTTHSNTIFSYENDGVLKTTESDNRSYDVSFNPGISAFVFNNVCASLSFQFGGLNYTKITQYDEAGELIGTRESSKMRFMFNVFAINFGVTVHLW